MVLEAKDNSQKTRSSNNSLRSYHKREEGPEWDFDSAGFGNEESPC